VSEMSLGHEFRSYTTEGFGVFAQALAVPVVVLAVALVSRSLSAGARKRDPWVAGLVLGWGFLLHQMLGYLALLVVAVLFLGAVVRGEAKRALLFAVKAALPFALVTAYQLVSIFQDMPLMHQTVFYDRSRMDGLGGWAVIRGLLSGSLTDFGRVPVFGLFALFEIARGLRGRTDRAWRVAAVLLAAGVVLLSGRSTFGRALPLVPALSHVNLERALGLLHLGLIFLAGLAVGEGLRLAGSLWRRRASAGVLLYVCLGLAVVYLHLQPIRYLRENARVIAEQKEANLYSKELLLSPLAPELGRGNLWAIQHGDALVPRIGRVPVYLAAAELGHSQISCAEHNMTYASDTVYLFSGRRRTDYEVFNVTAVLLPKRRDLEVPSFLEPIAASPSLVAFRAPGRGLWDVVTVAKSKETADEKEYIDELKAWLQSDLPRTSRYPSLVPAPVARRWPEALAKPAALEGGRVLSGSPLREHKSEARLWAEGDGSYGMMRTSFHPNWSIKVNGKPAAKRWVGPGYLAFNLTRGENLVEAEFRPDPFRLFLFYLSLAVSLGGLGMALISAFESRISISPKAKLVGRPGLEPGAR
jgi:hypothetical protein